VALEQTFKIFIQIQYIKSLHDLKDKYFLVTFQADRENCPIKENRLLSVQKMQKVFIYQCKMKVCFSYFDCKCVLQHGFDTFHSLKKSIFYLQRFSLGVA